MDHHTWHGTQKLLLIMCIGMQRSCANHGRGWCYLASPEKWIELPLRRQGASASGWPAMGGISTAWSTFWFLNQEHLFSLLAYHHFCLVFWKHVRSVILLKISHLCPVWFAAFLTHFPLLDFSYRFSSLVHFSLPERPNTAQLLTLN